MSVSLGEIWAVVDHLEMHTGKPILASQLKQICGVERTQLRKWVRDGRLNEYNATSDKGQLQKAYTRPREGVSDVIITQEEDAQNIG